MTWHDLLFLHWPIDAALLREFIPPALDIDTFDGSAWLGIVPFRMTGIRHRLLPPIPGLSAFPELNLRTYVRPRARDTGDGGGVWFFSLDATSRTAIRVARATYRLPYMNAAMRCSAADGSIRYQSRRTGPHTSLAFADARTRGAEFAATYRPIGPAFHSRPGTLEHFLTARYHLYAPGRAGLLRAEIDHAPWALHKAEAEVAVNTIAAPLGIDALPSAPGLPHLLFARRLSVTAWLPRPLQPS